MMKNKKSSTWKSCKVLYILPVIFISLSLFATPKKQKFHNGEFDIVVQSYLCTLLEEIEGRRRRG